MTRQRSDHRNERDDEHTIRLVYFCRDNLVTGGAVEGTEAVYSHGAERSWDWKSEIRAKYSRGDRGNAIHYMGKNKICISSEF